MNLNISEWKPFKINTMFEIYTGGDLIMGDIEEGDIPIASNSAENNNIATYTSIIEGRKLFDHTKSISIADRGKFWAFIQPKDFYIATRVKALVCKDYNLLNMYQLSFIVSVLNQESFKFAYGRNCCANLPYIDISLPIKYTLEGTPFIDQSCRYSEKGYVPDWDFMEEYMKSLHHKPLTTKNSQTSNIELEINKWEEFKISSILSIQNGKGITKEEIEDNPGDFTVVQSGEENNGVLGKIDKDYCISMNYTISEKPCLTVARSGSAGFVSFQIDGCVVGDSAKILLLEDNVASTEIYLFIQTILTANRFKYAYGRKVTEDKYMNDIIKLPIKHNPDGTPFIDQSCKYSDEGYVPDWDFMENYIKSLPYGDRLNDVV